MKKLQKDLREELKDEYDSFMTSSVSIAMTIAFFAHRNQERLNKESYIVHPKALADHFSKLSHIDDEDFDENDLYKVGLHYQGVLEVCWLHDVIEDTSYTLEDIRDVFYSESTSLGEYFDSFISRALTLITHDKSEPYPVYISKVCKNMTASLVKFLDLYNNSNPFTLDKLEEKELKRIQDYISYMKVINDKYHFIEKFNAYEDVLYLKRIKGEQDNV